MTFFRTPTLALALALALASPAWSQTEPAAPAPEAASASETPESAQDAAPSDPSVDGTAAAAMIEALSPLVADVQVVGPWADGERAGIWRTITLQPEGEGAGNRFFVQQIEERDGAPAVTTSIEVTEVGELAGALIGYRADPPSDAQPELLTMFLDIVPLDGELAETYELFLTATEPYTFGPASN